MNCIVYKNKCTIALLIVIKLLFMTGFAIQSTYINIDAMLKKLLQKNANMKNKYSIKTILNI